jgi:hypothetical protein
MDAKLYLLLSSAFYGYYVVCSVGYVATTGVSNWWKILVLVSLLWSVLYFSLLMHLLRTLNRRRSRIQFWITTGLSVVLIIVSTGSCFNKIVNDIDSKVFSIAYFTSVLVYFILTVLNSIVVKLRLLQSNEAFIEMV